jgi:hypothetical protein
MPKQRRKCVVSAVNPKLVEINRTNKEFWANQKVLNERRMANPAILQTAVETIAAQENQRVRFRYLKSFEEALQNAETTGRRFMSQFARTGGKASRGAPLPQLIEDIVQKDMDITCDGLLEKLRLRQGDGIIDDIDDSRIYFRSRRKTKRTATLGAGAEDIEKNTFSTWAPISGLKHRLTRARNKIRTETGSR